MPKHIVRRILPFKVKEKADRRPNETHDSSEELVRLHCSLQVPEVGIREEEVIDPLQLVPHGFKHVHASREGLGVRRYHTKLWLVHDFHEQCMLQLKEVL